MAKNYYKGKITVVFPAIKNQTPLMGKILPIWGNKANKGDQIFFNQFSLKKNDKFPEESGACEIDYNDTAKWRKSDNGNKVCYLPNIPFIVYFKIRAAKNKDGSIRLTAISIHTADTISLEDRTKADSITKQPSLMVLLNDEESTTKLQALEQACDEAVHAHKKFHKKKKQEEPNDEMVEEEELTEDEELTLAREKEWADEAENWHPSYQRPQDNLVTDPEEEEEESSDDYDEEVYDDYDDYNVKENKKGPKKMKGEN